MSILNFHGIGDPHSGIDSSEARYWISVERFRNVLDRVVAHRDHGHSILLTFDDGNFSDIEIGVPELRARGLRAHFFVLTGRCGDPHYLSAEDMRSLAACEMRVGLHGRDHMDWRRLDPPALDADVRVAREELAKITGQQVDSVAIPFGSYNRRVARYLKSLGFAEIYTSDGGLASDGAKLRHRLSIRKDMSDAEVESFLKGGEDHWQSRLITSVKRFLKEHVI
jgi:peptidoglycan/xylan/chitin deacetylase (PgdA/CDA1 family)